MMPNWTKEQKMAIEARGGTVLVSAAAGSGKTAVLVERVVRMLTDDVNPVDADRMLIVTFTKAAAAEMKSRILKRIAEMIESEGASPRLVRQKLLLQKTKIGTIHSFCGDCLREFFVQAGLAPDFKLLIDSHELEAMKRDILTGLVEESFEQHSGEFMELVDMVGEEKADGAIEQLVMKLNNAISASVYPERRLDDIEACYARDYDSADEMNTVRWLCGYVERMLTYAVKLYGAAAAALESSEASEKLLSDVADEFDSLEAALDRVRCGCGWDGCRAALNAIEFKKRISPAPKDAGGENFKNIRTQVRDHVKKLLALFVQNGSEIVETARRLSVPVCELCRLVREYRGRFAEQKKAQGIVDADDLEHMTAGLLVRNENGKLMRTAVAKELAARYDQILIDEYQDTNYTQDVIFRAISRGVGDEVTLSEDDESSAAESCGDDLFMVGDVKQSIYRFRKAAPALFMRRLESFARSEAEVAEYPAAIVLGANFRSRPEVTGTVNFVFSQLMKKERGGIEYSDGQQLISSGKFAAAQDRESEIHILSSSAADEGERGEILEARYCARLIRKMVSEGWQVSQGEGLRPAQFGDFCIMRRSIRGGHGDAFITQMAELGVPISIGSDSGFFEAPEIVLMLSLLKAVSNPLSDVPLAAALRSPVFGFDSDMLVRLKTFGGKRPVYDRLLKAAESDDEFGRKCKTVLETLKRLRRMAAVMSTDRLISAIYSESGLLASVQAMKNGGGRKANLLELRQMAREYESSGFKGLTRFVRMTDRMIEENEDRPAALSSSADSVSVRTIHSAKGLQFPVCLLSGLGSSMNVSSSSASDKCVIMNGSLGLGVMMRDSERRVRYKTPQYHAVDLRNVSEEVDESLRVLYVAMTRAIDKLIMVTTVSGADAGESSVKSLGGMVFGDGIDMTSLELNRSYSKWLLACAARHPSAGAAKLRELAGLEHIRPLAEESPLKVKILENDDPMLAPLGKAENEGIQPVEPDAAAMKMIRERFAFRYRQSLLSGIPAKVTASEIHRHTAGMVDARRPAFMSADHLTSAEKGTALHRFMQFCDFEKAAAAPQEECERLVRQGFLTEKEGGAVDIAKLGDFFERMNGILAGAERIEREWRFTVSLEPEMFRLFVPEAEPERRDEFVAAIRDGGRPVIMQGECDLLIIGSDGASVIDYKTDRGKSAEQLAGEYGAQVRLYADAIRQTLGCERVDCYIYSFSLSELITIAE